MSFNRDSFAAVFLLAVAAGLAVASLDIREPDYGQLSPAAWPRILLAVLAVLSGIYLVQSLRRGPDERPPETPRGPVAAILRQRNALWVFALFFLYIASIPHIGMLTGGVVFVFALLTALGGRRAWLLHGVIALATMGGVWLLFTQGLGVLLPRGEWTGF